MAYPNQIFTAFAFLGFLLCAIPLPWHLEAWNTGTCLYMIWTGLACLIQSINSIVWRGNAINWAPVWCDISTKFNIGTGVAIPAASLCINRRLYHIATVKTVTISKAEKRRAVYIDLAIGLGLPVLGMTLHYIPQGHRFNILEDIGCWPHTYNTWVAYVLVLIPPIIIGLISAIYAIGSIIAFNNRRTQFKELLSSHSNLTTSRYFRLMYLAGMELLCTVPITCYVLYLNSQVNTLHPWISWEDTHWRFSRVDNVPASVWRADKAVADALEFSRWLCVVCAIIFFGFFGFADEARRNYRSAVQSISKRVGINTTTTSSGTFFKFAAGGGSRSGGSGGGGTTGIGSQNTNTSMSKGGLLSSSSSSDGGLFIPGDNVTTRGHKIRQIPSIPVFVHKEVLSRRDSFDSSKMSKLGPGDVGVLGYLPEEEEKEATLDSQFVPTLSYGEITLNGDSVAGGGGGGGLLLSAPSSAASGPPPSFSSASPSLTRENSRSK